MRQAILRLSKAVCLTLVLSSCEGPPQELFGHGDSGAGGETGVNEGLTMRGFSWVVDEKLAGMPVLGRSQALALDIAFLDQQSIDLLVSLTLEPIPKEDLAARGIEGMHLPVKDFSAPSQAQMRTFVREIHERHRLGQRVGVHCTAGLGRSGTMLAAYFVSTGMNAEEAIANIRKLRPGSIETASQEDSIAEFAAGFLSPEEAIDSP